MGFAGRASQSLNLSIRARLLRPYICGQSRISYVLKDIAFGGLHIGFFAVFLGELS